MLSFQLTLLIISGYISLSLAQLFELTPSNIKDTISNGIWLIEYFSLSCPHAESFAPIWREVAMEAMEGNLHFGTIDCTAFRNLCIKYGIDSSPTIQIFENGELKEVYSGPKTYEDLTGFINEKLSNTISKLNKEKDALAHDKNAYKPNPRGISINLDGEGLNQIIKSHEYWFVKFYSPSCPHCIALGPTWSQMASDLRNQVNVAEVNCEALPSVCRQNSIPYVPLLRLYGGRAPFEYHGDRSLKSLLHFARSNSRHFIRDTDVNKLDLHSIEEENTALYYLYSDNDEIMESVKLVAQSLKILFYTSNDHSILDTLNIESAELPVLLMIKDGTHKVYPRVLENTLGSQENVAKWIKREQYPLVYHINNSDLITNRKLVIHIIDKINMIDQDKFYEIAANWSKFGNNDDALFAEMEFSQLRHFIKSEGKNYPQIIILDNLKCEYYTADQYHQLFSMDKPENIFNALDNLESLTGRKYNKSTLNNEYLRVFFFMLMFSAAAFIVQKYYTFYTTIFSKTKEVLPSYQAIGGLVKN